MAFLCASGARAVMLDCSALACRRLPVLEPYPGHLDPNDHMECKGRAMQGNARWGLRAFAVVFLILLVAPLFFPFETVDRALASLFYVPGESFPARFGSSYHVGVRKSVNVVTTIAAVFLGVALVWRVFLGRRFFGLSRQIVLYLVLALALGPGLLANGIFKEHWGRARPSQIVEFGGDKTYSPPLAITDQCETNCSFVSGDASVGFIFLALGFAARGRACKIAGFAIGAGLGSLFGFTRIAQGGHFFSDVLYSALFMLAVAWLLHYLVIKRDYLALPLMLLPQRGS